MQEIFREHQGVAVSAQKLLLGSFGIDHSEKVRGGISVSFPNLHFQTGRVSSQMESGSPVLIRVTASNRNLRVTIPKNSRNRV